MAESEGRPSSRGVPLGAFLPALVLILGISVLVTTDRYDAYGLYGIFAAFAGGVALTILAIPLRLVSYPSKAIARALLTVGVTLVAGAVLLYLVFGCVFGCPG